MRERAGFAVWGLAAVASHAALTGAIARLGGASSTADAMVGIGATCALALAAPAWWMTRGCPGAGRRRSVIFAGLLPFTLFLFFLAWQIGLSAEQSDACDGGEGEQCLRLAQRKLRRGRVDEALPHLERGCALGVADACLTLAAPRGSIAEVLSATPERRAEWTHRACELGEPRGCARLGRLLLRGEGVPLDEARGRAHLDAACAAGVADACGGDASGDRER